MAPALKGADPSRWLWVSLVLLLASVGIWGGVWSLGRPAGTSGAGAVPMPEWEAPDFHLIDQDGKPFGRSDLLGRPWVAGFIFTRCTALCPRVVAHMARLQKGTSVALVCFSVDPETDTPAVLKAYAESHGADLTRWRFLTGDKSLIYPLVSGGFHLSVSANSGASDPGDAVIHSDRLVLVDAQGRIRGTYPSGDPEAFSRLLEAVEGMR